MKLVSLNTWGGKIYEPLILFIKNQSIDTDIFCFQEMFDSNDEIKVSNGVRTHLFKEFGGVLANFNAYFAPTFEGMDQLGRVDFNLQFGLAIFAKKSIEIEKQGDFLTFGKKNSVDVNIFPEKLPRNAQYIQFILDKKLITVLHTHGIWVRGSRGDTPERIIQSKKIINFLNTQLGEKIIVGDFNLARDTESIRILSSNMRNLIEEFKVETTRSLFYPKRSFDKFADYAFVSPDLKLLNFDVPGVEVSDHLPMVLEFN